MKICDVFPDGTSALVTRGTLDLAYRDGVHGDAVAAGAGPGVRGRDRPRRLRLPVDAGPDAARVASPASDWPNTIAPPEPVSITLRTASLTLPLLDEVDFDIPVFGDGAEHSSESTEGVGWSIHHDVLHRTTTATTRSDSRYPTPYDGTAHELYLGEVSVDTRTFAQSANAHTVFDLTWPGIEVTVRSGMTVDGHTGDVRRVDLGDGGAQQPRRSATAPGRSRSRAERVRRSRARRARRRAAVRPPRVPSASSPRVSV